MASESFSEAVFYLATIDGISLPHPVSSSWQIAQKLAREIKVWTWTRVAEQAQKQGLDAIVAAEKLGLNAEMAAQKPEADRN